MQLFFFTFILTECHISKMSYKYVNLAPPTGNSLVTLCFEAYINLAATQTTHTT